MRDPAPRCGHALCLIDQREDVLLYVPQTPQIYEPSARRTFLKRCEPPEPLSSADFFLGASVTVFSRRLTITAFGDPQTERRFATKRSTTLAIVKPDAVGSTGDIIAAAVAAGLDTGRIAMLTLTAADVDRVFGTKTGAGGFATPPMTLPLSPNLPTVVLCWWCMSDCRTVRPASLCLLCPPCVTLSPLCCAVQTRRACDGS